MVSNATNITAEGYALDARQGNASIDGSLANKITTNINSINNINSKLSKMIYIKGQFHMCQVPVGYADYVYDINVNNYTPIAIAELYTTMPNDFSIRGYYFDENLKVHIHGYNARATATQVNLSFKIVYIKNGFF